MKPVIHLSFIYLLILVGMTLALNVAYPVEMNGSSSSSPKIETDRDHKQSNNRSKCYPTTDQ